MAQANLSDNKLGNMFTINWAYGLGVIMGVYVSFGVSGGHLNPAVSLAMAVSGKLSWKKVPLYFVGQYLGAFISSVFLYLVYYGKL